MLGHSDFDLARVGSGAFTVCPIRDCSANLVAIPYGKGMDRNGNSRTKPWCPVHGIRIHTGTFVYWNGPGSQDASRLRNFMVEQELVKQIAFEKGAKAESHRLGYEMSEDALSWNVFVSLAKAGMLREAATFFTGRTLSTEPDLYLWGKLIDVHGRRRGRFEPLWRVREYLEGDIRNFHTEPDIMLVVENEMVICIEAKFASGNSLAYDGKDKDGEKPTSRSALVDRYLGKARKANTRAAIHPEQMTARLHGQLFRNIIFASEMAAREWHVVNLVSSTQHKLGKDNSRSSFADPTADVSSYLSAEARSRFAYRTWEGLYAALVKGRQELAELDRYMRTKSAHFRPAFELN